MKYQLLNVALVLSLASAALAADFFPGQPLVSAAYAKVTAAIAELDKANREGVGKHVDNALTNFGAAQVQLEQAKKNKGSAPASAKKLIEQAKQELSATPVSKEKIESATKLANDALKKIVQAGNAQN